MKPIFCFIDDAQFELDNFRQHAAGAFERAQFVYASTFAQAQQDLAGRRPLCFLLDLYGTEPRAGQTHLPKAQKLKDLLGPQPPMGQFYQDLAEDPDPTNTLLRRLYSRVQAWQEVFLSAAKSAGQGRGYGLDNLDQVRRVYPWAAALGYSRKAFYSDAVALSLMGIEALLQKPQGRDQAHIARATAQQAPDLAQTAYTAVQRRLLGMASALGLRLALAEMDSPLAQALGQAAGHLGGPGLTPRASQAQAAQDLEQALGKTTGLAEWEQEGVMALAEWLASGPA